MNNYLFYQLKYKVLNDELKELYKKINKKDFYLLSEKDIEVAPKEIERIMTYIVFEADEKLVFGIIPLFPQIFVFPSFFTIKSDYPFFVNIINLLSDVSIKIRKGEPFAKIIAFATYEIIPVLKEN